MVSAKGTFVFIAGETGGGGGGGGVKRMNKTKHRARKIRKKRAVVAVWNGRKRGTMHSAYGGEMEPTRLLKGHGGKIRSLYAPDNPGDLTAETAVHRPV